MKRKEVLPVVFFAVAVVLLLAVVAVIASHYAKAVPTETAYEFKDHSEIKVYPAVPGALYARKYPTPFDSPLDDIRVIDVKEGWVQFTTERIYRSPVFEEHKQALTREIQDYLFFETVAERPAADTDYLQIHRNR